MAEPVRPDALEVGVMLSPVTRMDADDLIAGNRASRDFHTPWVAPFTDRDGFDAWFRQVVTGANVALVARRADAQAAVGGPGDVPGDVPGGGETGAGGAVIGVLTLSQITHGTFCSAYLGYYAMQPQAGRGLMTQALRMTVRHAFDLLGLHRLEANIQPANLPSIALVRRVGFRCEGFSPRYLFIDGAWRDHERWAILSDDPAGMAA
ncbi:GNAT family N-acetyltransferase [Novacetimonas pomaceti]|uniref:Phosphinothricin acetyltransferase n=1 Tax=Novacetimonas pomaceti TaxID=2021998 RepID=A0ABX5P5W0_9PROT|nr:GNAT family N-acetyltransferase [Novacetimonas pomaceti]PYD49180.1 phosphinothricin acetyltransferase [Novacetimonas pomaceti]